MSYYIQLWPLGMKYKDVVKPYQEKDIFVITQGRGGAEAEV